MKEIGTKNDNELQKLLTDTHHIMEWVEILSVTHADEQTERCLKKGNTFETSSPWSSIQLPEPPTDRPRDGAGFTRPAGRHGGDHVLRVPHHIKGKKCLWRLPMVSSRQGI